MTKKNTFLCTLLQSKLINRVFLEYLNACSCETRRHFHIKGHHGQSQGQGLPISILLRIVICQKSLFATRYRRKIKNNKPPISYTNYLPQRQPLIIRLLPWRRKNTVYNYVTTNPVEYSYELLDG